MNIDFTDPGLIYGLAFIISALFLLVCLDRYLTRRRSSAKNSEYLASVYSQARPESFTRHHDARQKSRIEDLTELESALKAALATGASLSRRQVVRDGFGRVIATHEEEIALIPPTRKMLVA